MEGTGETDSVAEEDGFEPSVPLERNHASRDCQLTFGISFRPREPTLFARGTEGSNPSSSTGESLFPRQDTFSRLGTLSRKDYRPSGVNVSHQLLAIPIPLIRVVTSGESVIGEREVLRR